MICDILIQNKNERLLVKKGKFEETLFSSINRDNVNYTLFIPVDIYSLKLNLHLFKFLFHLNSYLKR